jgi:hypothetical protein
MAPLSAGPGAAAADKRAIYNPDHGQVKNAKIHCFSAGLGQKPPLFATPRTGIEAEVNGSERVIPF